MSKQTREEVVAWATQEYCQGIIRVSCMKRLLDTLEDEDLLYCDNDRALIGAVHHEGKLILITGKETDYE